MPTSFTTNLRLSNPGLGDTGWGSTVSNGMIDLTDQAIAGTTTLSTDADVTLTTANGVTDQARQMILNCTGSRAAQRTITAPASSKAYVVINSTTGGFGVKIVGVGPTTGVVVPAGRMAVVAWNGSDFVTLGAVVDLTASGNVTLTALTASTALALDANKQIVSVTNTGTGNNVLATSPILVTPNLGTPSAVTLTNATGLPIDAGTTGTLPAARGGTGQTSYAVGDLLYADTTTSLAKLADVATGNVLISGGIGVVPSWGKVGLATHVSGTLPVANGGTGIASFGAGVATWLGTPSSANLAAAVTDETGTGALVFANTPTLVSPLLGTPTSGVMTNVTGLPLTTGVTGTLPVANGGTGQTTQQAAITALAGSATSGQYLRGDGSNVVMSAIQAADVPTLNQNTTGTASNVTGVVAVANGGTGATTLTGILKGNGTAAFTIASSGTDYAPATSGTAILYGNGSGGFSNVTIGSGLSFAGGTLSATGSGGTVTSVTASAPLASSGGATPNISFTGTLAIANGGTGAATLAANNVLLGNGTSAVQAVAPGTSGNVLTSNGTTWTSATPAAAPVTSVNGLTGAVSMTGLGDIGSYAVLIIATNTNLAAGATVAGSDLRHSWTPNTGAVAASTNGYSAYSANRSNSSASYNGGGTSLSGTWRKMSTGATYGTITGGCCGVTAYYWMAALYVRIS